MDGFHTKFVLLRSLDPEWTSSGMLRLKSVTSYQSRVKDAPNLIQERDGLVAELIGLGARAYEDARTAVKEGASTEFAEQGLRLSRQVSMQAFDQLDVMATLYLAAESTPRRTALHAGVGYNMIVGLLEFNRRSEAQGLLRELRVDLDKVRHMAGSEEPVFTSIDGFVRAIEHLA